MRYFHLHAILPAAIAAALVFAGPAASANSSRSLIHRSYAGSQYIGTTATLTGFNGNYAYAATFDTDDGNFYVANNIGVERVASDGQLTLVANLPSFGASIVWDHGSQLFYIGEPNSYQIMTMTPQGAVSVLAGSGSRGTADGKGTQAQFQWPSGIALDSANQALYVGDSDRLRRVGFDGTVSTVGPIGVLAGGSYGLYGLTMDTGSGQVIIADQSVNIVRAFTPSSGTYTTAAGRCVTVQFSGCLAFQFDGPGAKSLFATPVGVAYNASNNLIYVTDDNNFEIRTISALDKVETMAGSGSQTIQDGIRYTASFDGPSCAAIDPSTGLMLVCDNNGSVLRTVTTEGTTYPLPAHHFIMGLTPSLYTNPSGAAATADGSIWFAESFTNYIGQLQPSGRIVERALPGGFVNPTGAAIGPNDTVFFTDMTGTAGSFQAYVASLDSLRRVHETLFYNYCGGYAQSTPSAYATGANGDEWFINSCPGGFGFITPKHSITQFPASSIIALAVGDGPYEWVGSANALEQHSVNGQLVKSWVTTADGGVAVAPNGKVWFDGNSYNGPVLGNVDPSTGVLKYYTLPNCGCNRGLGTLKIGPDGAAWFLEGAPGKNSAYPATVGRMTPSGKFTEYSTYAPRSQPSGLTFDKNGRLWLVDQGSQKIGYLK